MPDLVKPFGVQFGQAIDNLKGKLPEATMKWDDLAGPVHGKVFAIAGATNTDLVADIQKSLVDALKNGTTITQFRKDFDATVQKYGWTYRGKRGWRTSVIFNNNMRSAHMAGRWEQLQANKARRPFLQYRTAGDARVRPMHRMWNGLIFPIDDAFWQTHYPPNGWGCRCTVRAYSQADLDDGNLQVSEPFQVKTREVVTRDGEITDRVPVGIDPGWDHNVGQSWIAPELALGQKIAALPKPLQGLLADKAVSPAYQKVLNDNFKAFKTAIKQPVGQAQIVGFMDSGMINAIAEKLPEVELQTTSVSVLDSKTNHLAGRHKVNSPQVWPEEWANNLPEHFRNYQAVLLDKKSGNLIVVPQDSFNTMLPKIVLRLNQRTKIGLSATVVSLGAAAAGDLGNADAYELLLGALTK
ncbi:phage minor head protein [Rhodoferax aquaticus]|uniref:Phage head morphogenesis protein n=1 Tax=Rhodoferax aquaticus TaxID=2527691 RepID=A0A515ETC1_9BURK|nr:phage minor head protein [Rhodoferax aquaticus]QDL55901.1 phage head morphogenesis protein [Rhodoferax aquaticus]